eukprot:COSAG02_NODE_963_length_15604_cov_10.737117_6_plen_150_part_00
MPFSLDTSVDEEQRIRMGTGAHTLGTGSGRPPLRPQSPEYFATDFSYQPFPRDYLGTRTRTYDRQPVMGIAHPNLPVPGGAIRRMTRMPGHVADHMREGDVVAKLVAIHSSRHCLLFAPSTVDTIMPGLDRYSSMTGWKRDTDTGRKAL